MSNDWETAVVVDPRELQCLRDENARLRAAHRRQRLGLGLFIALGVVTSAGLWWEATRLGRITREARACRKSAQRSSTVLTALARSHEHILAATENSPSVGTKSWGRRFTITKYLPRSPAYGRDNDGLTATLVKADPRARIVAVDPKLIPYGSWVWVEGLGWYHAQDCGGAIKGFRLDLLTGSEQDAIRFGKQDRFVIVVPAEDA